MVAAPRAIAVEIGFRDLMLLQIGARRAVRLDAAGRADVVGGDRIAQHRQRLGLDDVGDGRGRHLHPVEIGRVGDIGGAGAPLERLRTLNLDRAPFIVAGVDVAITCPEHLVVDVRVHQVAHLVVGRPYIFQEHVLPVRSLAKRRFDHVLRHRALERIGDHQRRRGEEVRAHVLADASFEIAIARQDRGGDQIILVDRLGDRRRERAGIADAGGAAIADEVEPHRVQILGQPRLVEIIGHDLRSGAPARS